LPRATPSVGIINTILYPLHGFRETSNSQCREGGAAGIENTKSMESCQMNNCVVVEMGTSWEFEHGEKREMFCCWNALQ